VTAIGDGSVGIYKCIILEGAGAIRNMRKCPHLQSVDEEYEAGEGFIYDGVIEDQYA
jgi:hypothetical protein